MFEHQLCIGTVAFAKGTMPPQREATKKAPLVGWTTIPVRADAA